MKGLNATYISVPMLQFFLLLDNIVETLIMTKSFHTQFYIILLAGKFADSNRRSREKIRGKTQKGVWEIRQSLQGEKLIPNNADAFSKEARAIRYHG